ncbi:hypothetical protein MAAFP003_4249 [Mycobacterium ahvazicum]|uniref:Uncharacterized protein n=1 Tax=Mycobacterium ahvazicum TaxID=1964395 RepID=A0A2K4YFK2_9MYCO|nr:hypothetical protein [Mycobacterium ahvazicum]SOX55557.1 hypothetical protein MAAFP003_4249 [Mycobacterium ahvazicum]
MPSIWTYVKAAAVVVGSSAALLTGGIAHADPAPIPDPGLQNIPQQLIASAANAPQILQNLATALGAQPPQAPPQPGITFPGLSSAAQAPAASAPAGVPSIPGLTPATPAPTAASPTVPGLSSIPGLGQTTPAAPTAPASSGIPGLSSIPGLTSPAAPAAAPASAPQVANVNMPALPGLPLNVPPKLSLPGDLTSLAAGAVPGTAAAPAAAAPAATPLSPLLSAIP